MNPGPAKGGYGRAVRRVLGAVLVGLVVLAAGCAPAPPPSEVAPPPKGLQLPPRPRDVRIDGVDPCSLVTPAQRAGLGLDDRVDPFVDQSRLYQGSVPSCHLERPAPRNALIALGVVTTVGIDLFADGSLDADIRAASVRDFPAIVAVPRRFHDYCSVEIDVAPGQLIDVQFGDVALPPPIPQDELCRDAEQLGKAVMDTLLSRP